MAEGAVYGGGRGGVLCRKMGGGEIENFQLKMSKIYRFYQFLAKLFNFDNFRINCSNPSGIGQI